MTSRRDLRSAVLKGEGPGHPFRGNQYVKGRSGGASGLSADQRYRLRVEIADGDNWKAKRQQSHIEVDAASETEARLVAQQMAMTPMQGKPSHMQVYVKEVEGLSANQSSSKWVDVRELHFPAFKVGDRVKPMSAKDEKRFGHGTVTEVADKYGSRYVIEWDRKWSSSQRGAGPANVESGPGLHSMLLPAEFERPKPPPLAPPDHQPAISNIERVGDNWYEIEVEPYRAVDYQTGKECLVTGFSAGYGINGVGFLINKDGMVGEKYSKSLYIKPPENVREAIKAAKAEQAAEEDGLSSDQRTIEFHEQLVAEGDSPLDYGAAPGRVKRIAIVDSGATGERPAPTEYFKGAEPGTVAFVDYESSGAVPGPATHPSELTFYIHFVATSHLRRHAGLATKAMRALYKKYPEASFDWGRLMEPEVGAMYDKFREDYPDRTYGGEDWYSDRSVHKEADGHPFRGNQYTKGRSGGGVDGLSSNQVRPSAGKTIMRHVRDPDGGTTIDMRHGFKPAKHGIAVAVRPKDSLSVPASKIDAATIDKWVAEHKEALSKPGAHVGAWHNPEDGRVYLDVVRVFKQSQRHIAIEAGRRLNQIAIADLDAISNGDWDNAFINTGGTGKDGVHKSGGKMRFTVFAPDATSEDIAGWIRSGKVSKAPDVKGPRKDRGLDEEHLRIREEVLASNPKCVKCGKPADTVNHKKRRSHGGKNSRSNYEPMCLSCNSRDGAIQQHKDAGHEMSKSETILKFDDERRIVWGWAYKAENEDGTVRVDTHGDFMDDPREVEDMAYNFVLTSGLGDEMHLDVPVSKVVESVVFTPEKLAKMGVPQGALPQTAWWVGFKVEDDAVWEAVKKGQYRAFSIGGRGMREYVDSSVVERENMRRSLIAKEGAGHPFRGNQYTKGRSDGKAKPAKKPKKPAVVGGLTSNMAAKKPKKRTTRPAVFRGEPLSLSQKGKIARRARRAKTHQFIAEYREKNPSDLSDAGVKRISDAQARAKAKHDKRKAMREGLTGDLVSEKRKELVDTITDTKTKPTGKKVKARSVKQAIELLAQGHEVELSQPRQVSTLLKSLKKIVDEAEAKGEEAPVYDLCKVSVKGTNLFCAETKGIPRIKMPQFSTKNPIPGSKADKKGKNERGEVDISEEFVQHMRDKGYKVTDETEMASYLRASQNELKGNKVAGIASKFRAGKLPDGSIFVSEDNYVVDGHHRWAAVVGVDYDDGKGGDVKMAVRRVHAPILDVLAEANAFTEEWGIPGADVSKSAPPCIGCDQHRSRFRLRLLA